MKNKKRRLPINDKYIVFEYFRLIKNKDIKHLLDLFAYDAIIYEPFSKLTGGLRGRSSIESFLKVVIMANDALQHHIIIENKSDNHMENADTMNGNNTSYDDRNNKVVAALVTFKRGDSVKARFTFQLDSQDVKDINNPFHVYNSKQKKIKTLHIQFIE